jgi:integrase
MRLDEIRQETIERFYATMVRKDLSPKSRKNIASTLRRILASAVEWGVLDALPRFPRIRVPEASFDFFNREESDAVVATARSAEEHALLLFAFHTGARAGEQLALEWGDIDWHNKLVIFRRSSTRGIVGPTKSGRERKVPLTESLASALRAIRHLRSDLIFCNEDGSPMSLWQLHERLWRGCRKAGLRKIRWHDCRHSFASQLVMAGTPMRLVQAWMGHSTIQMTMRYSHLAPGGGQEFIAALDRSANGNLTATRTSTA